MNEEGGSGKRIVYCLLENEKRIVKDKGKNFEKMYLFTHERGGMSKLTTINKIGRASCRERV